MRTDTDTRNTIAIADTSDHSVTESDCVADTRDTNTDGDTNRNGNANTGNSTAVAESVAGDSGHQPINSYER